MSLFFFLIIATLSDMLNYFVKSLIYLNLKFLVNRNQYVQSCSYTANMYIKSNETLIFKSLASLENLQVKIVISNKYKIK